MAFLFSVSSATTVYVTVCVAPHGNEHIMLLTLAGKQKAAKVPPLLIHKKVPHDCHMQIFCFVFYDFLFVLLVEFAA
jgi:hypothetical protein